MSTFVWVLDVGSQHGAVMEVVGLSVLCWEKESTCWLPGDEFVAVGAMLHVCYRHAQKKYSKAIVKNMISAHGIGLSCRLGFLSFILFSSLDGR